jgi:hypothetical protein
LVPVRCDVAPGSARSTAGTGIWQPTRITFLLDHLRLVLFTVGALGTRNVVPNGAKVLLPATVKYGNRTCFCGFAFYGVCDVGAKGWRGSPILSESPSSGSAICAQTGPVFGSCLPDIGQRSAAP